MLKIYGAFGLNGTFPAVWLAHIGFGMSLAIYILRNYMATLPKTIIESAKIDGASHYQTFFRLILPMSVPALASFAIFQFLWVWNDLLVALVFIGPGENEPLTVALTHLQDPAGPGLGADHGRWLPLDDRADHRVPGAAAVLRPRPDRGSRQGLTAGDTRDARAALRCPGVARRSSSDHLPPTSGPPRCSSRPVSCRRRAPAPASSSTTRGPASPTWPGPATSRAVRRPRAVSRPSGAPPACRSSASTRPVVTPVPTCADTGYDRAVAPAAPGPPASRPTRSRSPMTPSSCGPPTSTPSWRSSSSSSHWSAGRCAAAGR